MTDRVAIDNALALLKAAGYPVEYLLPRPIHHAVRVEFVFEKKYLTPDETVVNLIKIERRHGVDLSEDEMTTIAETFAQSDEMQEILGQVGSVIADGEPLYTRYGAEKENRVELR